MISLPKQRYLMYVSYIGTGFRGSQIQKNTPDYKSNTIQGEVATSLTELLKISSDNLISTCFSSRTDTGVHAFMNGVHFDLPLINGQHIECKHIKNGLNNRFISKDVNIRVIKVLKVPDIFNARRSACEKTYIYRIAVPKGSEKKSIHIFPLIENKRTFFLRCHNLDVEKVQEVEKLYVGENDFASFTAQLSKNTRSTICKLTSFKFSKSLPLMQDWNPADFSFDCYHFTCTGNRFLQHMVRRLVSVALAVGCLHLSLADVRQMFEEPGPWKKPVYTVPGYGLYLAHIKYKADDLIISEEEKKRKSELLSEIIQNEDLATNNKEKPFSKFREFMEKTSHFTKT